MCKDMYNTDLQKHLREKSGRQATHPDHHKLP